MIRASTLPVSRYCGLAASLAAENPEAGRSALMSSVFHEMCASPNGTGTRDRWAMLTEDEQREILTWKKPEDVQPPRGPLLRYADAEQELTLAVDEYMSPCDPESPEALIRGTLDFAWLVSAKDGHRVAFVADIKRTHWTTIDGPESPQLIAYALMFAAKHNADAYCTGIWVAEEGKWEWSDRITRVDSPDGMRHLRLVRAAARNDTGEACLGSHCSTHCYSRLKCPAYVAPAPQEGILGPALRQELTEQNALPALIEMQRLENILKLAKENLKAAVLHGLPVVSEDGSKKYAAITCKGRKSFNEKLARQKLGDSTIDGFVTRGSEYTQYRWIKA